MADLGSSVKGLWMKGMEAIGNAASNIASNTKSKVDEMNLVNRRNELLKDISVQAYALWQKGIKFPDELNRKLQDLSKLDDLLVDLRAERLAGVKAEPAKENQAPENESAAENQAEGAEAPTLETPAEDAGEADDGENKPPVIRVENGTEADAEDSSLSGVIQDLFDQVPSAEEAAQKVNSALDSLQDHLEGFAGNVDQGIESLTERLQGNQQGNQQNPPAE